MAVQVAVMPKTTMVIDCPLRLSPEATVPVSGPVEMGWPAVMAGLELPVKDVVPPLALLITSVELTEFAPTLIGLVIAAVDTVMVAEVPSWVAARVAEPEPKDPQSKERVALSGETALAAGARTRAPVTAMPATRAVPRPSLPLCMVVPFRVAWNGWFSHVADRRALDSSRIGEPPTRVWARLQSGAQGTESNGSDG